MARGADVTRMFEPVNEMSPIPCARAGLVRSSGMAPVGQLGVAKQSLGVVVNNIKFHGTHVPHNPELSTASNAPRTQLPRRAENANFDAPLGGLRATEVAHSTLILTEDVMRRHRVAVELGCEPPRTASGSSSGGVSLMFGTQTPAHRDATPHDVRLIGTAIATSIIRRRARYTDHCNPICLCS